MTVNSGNVTVTVADDKTHTYSLPVESGYGVVTDGSAVTGSYSANGDGIDCNGSFYAKGGTTVVWGPLSGDNSPVDIADSGAEYVIYEGAEVMTCGSSGSMLTSPTLSGQSAVVFSGSSISSGAGLSIHDADGNVLISGNNPKVISYVMYSSPSLVTGSTYYLYSGSSSAASAAASDTVSGGQGPGQGPGQGQDPGQGPGQEPGH